MRRIVLGVISSLLLTYMLRLNSVCASPVSVTLRPNADGTYTEWNVEGATSCWDAVSDVTPDGDSSYITTLLLSKTCTFDLSDIPSDTSVTSVELHVIAKGKPYFSSWASIELMVILSNHMTWGYPLTLTGYYVELIRTYSNASLTGSDVNALEVGVRHAGSWFCEAFVTQVYVVVDMKSTLAYDLNKDGEVNITDITMVAVAFGSKPGDPKWNAIADIDDNGTINIVDITKVGKDYGKNV